jgi:hypothetical protein
MPRHRRWAFANAVSVHTEIDLPELSGDAVRPRRWLPAAFHVDLEDVPGAVLNVRALKAFDLSPARYPIHRVVCCVARGSPVELFDDLALRSGLAAHRLGSGSLFLDGPGVLAILKGSSKAYYTSCRFTLWTETLERALAVEALLMEIIGERRMTEETFTIDWRFGTGDGGLTGVEFEELVDPALLDEAYPALNQSVAEFIERYLAAPETILIVQGPPGTGKTRLVRAILGTLSRRKSGRGSVLYTADRRALENDRIFMEFLTEDHDAFVVEDADHILASRANGNLDMHRFLAIADGIVRAQGRKILFTTNLPNVGDIDEALLRPGRCFANVRTRALSRSEAERLVRRICGGEGERSDTVMGRLLRSGASSMTLAAIYQYLPPDLR